MNRFRKVSHPCLTTRGFTALRCPFGATLSLVRHGLASFDLQTFLRTKTVNKKVSTFKGALTAPEPKATEIRYLLVPRATRRKGDAAAQSLPRVCRRTA